MAKLPTNAQSAARLLYAQYDAINDVREEAEKKMVEESHRHPITRVIETCPGVGPIRAAQIVSVVVTPDRFRKHQQFWSYCGLGLVMRSSSDWVKSEKGTWARATVNKTRGLNFNHNHLLKQVFKGAATTIVTQLSEHPLRADYQRMLDGGTKPNLAQVTLARKAASIALAMWKRKEVYDAVKHSVAVVIACLDEWEATARQVNRDGSRDARETSRNRRRASIESLDEERDGSTRKALESPHG